MKDFVDDWIQVKKGVQDKESIYFEDYKFYKEFVWEIQKWAIDILTWAKMAHTIKLFEDVIKTSTRELKWIREQEKLKKGEKTLKQSELDIP